MNDDQLDQHLSRTLHRMFPEPADPTLQLPDPATRAPRARAAVIATIAAVAAVAAAVVALTVTRSLPGPQPAASSSATQRRPVSGSTAPGAPCQSGELTLEFAGTSAATMHSYLYLRFRNAAPTSCTMAGYPQIAALDTASGTPLRLRVQRRADPGPASGTPMVTLAAGGAAWFVLETFADPSGTPCPDPHPHATLTIQPPDAPGALNYPHWAQCDGESVWVSAVQPGTGPPSNQPTGPNVTPTFTLGGRPKPTR